VAFDSQDLHFIALSVRNIALLILQPRCYKSGGTLGHKKSFLERISMQFKCYLLICIGPSLSFYEHISTSLGHIMTFSF
jgi:hypothetical protein